MQKDHVSFRLRPARTRSVSHQSGVTLIEVLVIALILGITLAIAIPRYAVSVKYSKQQACQANMAAVFQAEEAYRVRNRAYGTLTQIGATETCPSGTAAYTVVPTTTTVTITCPNANAHATNKMRTTDGATFTFVP